ncbi:MAG TPA: cytochrome c [Thermohalobaculum sp.]|nr:cytochrome c [Thermohalobaculum sp.]
MSRPVAIALACVLLAAVPARAGELPPGRQAELERLVRHDCGSCHGLTLRGGLGPAIGRGRLAGADAEALAEIILDGVPGTPMPPWRGLLSEGEARWIAEYLTRAE